MSILSPGIEKYLSHIVSVEMDLHSAKCCFMTVKAGDVEEIWGDFFGDDLGDLQEAFTGFRAEFDKLLQVFGLAFPVRVLLEANKNNFRHTMILGELQTNQSFALPSEINKCGQTKNIYTIVNPRYDGGVLVNTAIQGCKGEQKFDIETPVIPWLDECQEPLLSPAFYISFAELMREKTRLEQSIHDRVDKLIGEDSPIIYSGFPEDEDGFPVDNLDSCPVPGKVVVKYKTWNSEVLNSPTWLDLCKQADLAVKSQLSLNDEHVFFRWLNFFGEHEGCKQVRLVLAVEPN